MLQHLVVNPYDPSLDYVEFAKQAFGGNRALFMLESKQKPHLHIQGELSCTLKYFTMLKEVLLTKKHYKFVAWEAETDPKKKKDLACHPCKKRKREADEIGFQYMCKDLDSSMVVFKQGFTDEDLEELHANSNAHREELKGKLGEYIVGEVNRGDGEAPQVLHKRIARAAVKYYLAEDKMQPPNLRALIRHILVTKYTAEDVIDYCTDLLM